MIKDMDEFKEKVVMSENTFIVDYYATWCQPCKQLDLILKKHEAEWKKAGVELIKINVNAASDVAGAYMIQTLPTVQVFKGGVIVKTLEGLRQPEAYINLLNEEE
jgi:thioredoxin 1